MKFDLGHIKKVAAIHIVLNGKQITYHYLLLKKSKDEIDFVKQGENITDIDDLIKKVSDYPVLLHFTGKGILNRKAVFQENYHHSILLNANIDAFYFSDYIENKTVYSSVIRKDAVDETMALFTAKKCQVISVSSGPFHTAMLNAILNKEELIVADIKMEFEQKKLIGFSKILPTDEIEQRSILLGTERISNNLIPAATAGAAFFNPNEKLVFPQSDEVFLHNLEDAKQKNIFTRFGMVLMIFFLLILTLNYFYLGHLNQVVMDNSVYLSEYDEQLAQIADLKEEVQRKETLLQSSGLLNKNFLSFYLMEIANSVPKEIIFDEIVLRPLQDEIKPRKKIAFEEHLVLVNGRAKTSHILSRWIEKIEQNEWLSKVDILSYDYVHNEGVFELEIIVF